MIFRMAWQLDFLAQGSTCLWKPLALMLTAVDLLPYKGHSPSSLSLKKFNVFP